MTIATNCPDCNASYNLDPSLAGKRVRCRQCESSFLVDVPRVEAVESRGGGRHAQPAPRRRTREDSDPDIRDSRPGSGGGSGVLLWVLGGVGAFALLVLLICGGSIFYFVYSVKKTVNTVSQNFKNMKPPTPRSIYSPNSFEEALVNLNDPVAGKRQAAVKWLGSHPVNAGRQNEIARALEQRLQDDNSRVRADAMKALSAWATPANAPAILRAYQRPARTHDDRRLHSEARKVLIKFKDSSAARVFAAELKDRSKRFDAQRALESMGSSVESVVRPYLHDGDRNVKRTAAYILRKIGTQQSMAELQRAHAQAVASRDHSQKFYLELAMRDIKKRHGLP